MSKVRKESDAIEAERRKVRVPLLARKVVLAVLVVTLVYTMPKPAEASWWRAAGVAVASAVGSIRAYHSPNCMGPGVTQSYTFLGLHFFGPGDKNEAYHEGFRSYRDNHGDCHNLSPNNISLGMGLLRRLPYHNQPPVMPPSGDDD